MSLHRKVGRAAVLGGAKNQRAVKREEGAVQAGHQEAGGERQAHLLLHPHQPRA